MTVNGNGRHTVTTQVNLSTKQHYRLIALEGTMMEQQYVTFVINQNLFLLLRSTLQQFFKQSLRAVLPSAELQASAWHQTKAQDPRAFLQSSTIRKRPRFTWFYSYYRKTPRISFVRAGRLHTSILLYSKIRREPRHVSVVIR